MLAIYINSIDYNASIQVWSKKDHLTKILVKLYPGYMKIFSTKELRYNWELKAGQYRVRSRGKSQKLYNSI